MGEDKNGWDVKGITNHLSLMFSAVKEHGSEAFRELVLKEPEKAINQFDHFLDKVLSVGDGMFRGYGCGGPCELVTAPLLDTVGLVYPLMDKPKRELALKKCLSFLDGLNYFNSQNNVQYINEPWLVADIITNRRLYNPGYADCADRLKGIETDEQFEKAFIKDGYLDVKSIAFLGTAISRVQYCSTGARMAFTERYPEITERVKGMAAAKANDYATSEQILKNIPYEKTIDEYLARYAPEWNEDIRAQIKKADFILLESTVEQYKRWKEDELRNPSD